MSNWPLHSAALPSFIGAGSPDTVSAVVTTDASNIPSAWVEVVSSLSFATAAVHLTIRTESSRRYVVELAIGASGSEVIVATIPLASQIVTASGSTTLGFYYPTLVLPLTLPKGARLAARVTGAQSSVRDVHVTVQIVPRSFLSPVGFHHCTTHGIQSDLRLTAVVASGTSFGAWAEILASAPYAVRGVMLCASLGDNVTVLSAQTRVEFQLAVGSSGSEVEQYLRPQAFRFSDVPSQVFSPVLPVQYPAGTRFAVRCRLQAVATTDNQQAALILFG